MAQSGDLLGERLLTPVCHTHARHQYHTMKVKTKVEDTRRAMRREVTGVTSSKALHTSVRAGEGRLPASWVRSPGLPHRQPREGGTDGTTRLHRLEKRQRWSNTARNWRCVTQSAEAGVSPYRKCLPGRTTCGSSRRGDQALCRSLQTAERRRPGARSCAPGKHRGEVLVTATTETR